MQRFTLVALLLATLGWAGFVAFTSHGSGATRPGGLHAMDDGTPPPTPPFNPGP